MRPKIVDNTHTQRVGAKETLKRVGGKRSFKKGGRQKRLLEMARKLVKGGTIGNHIA